MNRFCTWAAACLAGTLSTEERDAVLGDLAESKAKPAEIVRDLLGLVLRRQAAQWLHWRAWLVLAGMTVPFAILLRLAAAYLSHTSAIYIWMFADNWDPALLDVAGYRHELARAATSIVGIAAGLAFVSWCAGCALAVAARATRVVNAAVFTFLLIPSATHDYGVNRAVFALLFYRLIYPLLISAALVIAPCWLGIRRGRFRGTT
jgi:hypothetical protein